jgi:hypothetical protein
MITCQVESNLSFSGEMMLVAVATMFSATVMRVYGKFSRSGFYVNGFYVRNKVAWIRSTLCSRRLSISISRFCVIYELPVNKEKGSSGELGAVSQNRSLLFLHAFHSWQLPFASCCDYPWYLTHSE